MSNQTQNRQPKGTPTGGQYAETRRADPMGVELSEPEQGACVLTGSIHEDPDDCTTHTHESDGLPAPDSDEADPWLYDGDNVDALAARDNWAPKDWENYYDARHERELEEAHSAPISHEGVTAQLMTSEIDGAVLVQIDTPGLDAGRKVRVVINDGDVYDGDPEVDETIDQKLEKQASPGDYASQLDSIMGVYHDIHDRMERASAGVVAQIVREQYPDARYVTLEDSDQGEYWTGVEILGDDRETIGDWEDIEYGDREDDAIAITNFRNDGRGYPFIVASADGRTEYLDLDAAEKYARGE